MPIFVPPTWPPAGKGAPLVPYVDYLLYRDAERGRVALNIGGIANLTAIGPGAGPDEVIAFDTGPGNMIIDGLVEEFTNGAERFDRDGERAASGRVAEALLGRLTALPYFDEPPPKSAGREQFGGGVRRGFGGARDRAARFDRDGDGLQRRNDRRGHSKMGRPEDAG